MTLLGETGNGWSYHSDVVGTILYAMLTAGAGWLLSRVLHEDRAIRALLATLVVLWAALFGTFRLLMTDKWPILGEESGLLLLWWSTGFGMVAWLIRSRTSASGQMLRAVTVTLLLLCVVPLVGLARTAFTAIARERVEPVFVADRRDGVTPDIYLIVTDMFGHPSALERDYGLDIQWFVDSLKALGFVLPSSSRTNYVHTGLLLPAMLYGRPVHQELEAAGGHVWGAATRMIRDAPIWDHLRNSGYRLFYFETAYKVTETLPKADVLIQAPEPPLMGFGQTWIFNTPLDMLRAKLCLVGCVKVIGIPNPAESASAWKWKLSLLETLPDSAGPTAAVLHFLGSHEPFVFDADCAARTPWWPYRVTDDDSLAVRQAYADQIACVSRLLLASVSELVRKSAISPIILIQSDHGSGEIRNGDMVSGTVTASQASPRQLLGRLEVLAAYRFPGAEAVVYDTITPINVMRLVFGTEAGYDPTPVPDGGWWSTWLAPLDVTPYWWRGDTLFIESDEPPTHRMVVGTNK